MQDLGQRLVEAVAPLTWSQSLVVVGGLVGYGAIAIPYGFHSQFLRWHVVIGPPLNFLFRLLWLLLLPALVEELLFRVLLLPHPVEALPLNQWLLWAGLSLGLFVVYHFFSASTYYPAGNPTFFDRRFVVLTTWLGLVLTLAYGLTGSLWVVTLIHWAVVVVWLQILGGLPLLEREAWGGEDPATPE